MYLIRVPVPFQLRRKFYLAHLLSGKRRAFSR
jgi:hypothetical protein